MVELRKRKPAQEPAAPPPAKKKSNPIKSAVDKAKTAFGGEKKTNGTAPSPTAKSTKAVVGETVSLDSFGGEVETNEGVKTSLKKLVDESSSGVVLFTYPKASTPGCTTQACLFRDAYSHLTSSGLSIYGLSTDSPKSNTTFKEKQKLPYPLLCDPSATLISAVGFKKAPKGTTRGVFIIDKSGKVLAAEPGGPQATVDVVANLIKDGKISGSAADPSTAEAIKTTAEEAPAEEKEDIPAPTTGATEEAPAAAVEEPAKMDESPLIKEPSKEEEETANTAADVAESAAKLDTNGLETATAEVKA